MAKASVFLVLFFPLLSLGRVSLSEQYSFPPALVSKLEEKIEKALARSPEMQAYMVFYEIDGKNGINLTCGPNLPRKDGSGCILNFRLALPSPSISFQKRVLAKGKGQEIETRLAKVDPNSTEEHLQFGSLFDPLDTFGSHYFCEPVGEPGKKSWACKLFVNELVN